MSPRSRAGAAKRWQLKPADSAEVDRLASDTGLPPAVARVMVARGVLVGEAADHFLKPQLSHLLPPGTMAGLDQAARRIFDAMQAGEPMAIFGDYDVDGISSTALMGDYLRRAGSEAHLRVARRDEGYGFGEAQAREMAESGAKVLLLLDCGTSDHEAVTLAREAGLDVLAVDHHQVTRGEWPGTVLVNPQRPDCGYPFKDLTTVGLAFHLTARLRRLLQDAGREAPDPRSGLDLVALGTIADVAPLVTVNRVLVSAGLEYLLRTRRPGLRELMRLCDLERKKLTSEDVAWRISPRLNAPGRLGDAGMSLKCLYEDDVALGASAAARCHELNDERRQLQERVLDEALEQGRHQVEQEGADFVLVSSESWHPGVLGIVAARLAETFSRPAAAVSISGGEPRASARSVPGVDLVSLLKQCAHLLIRYGGHTAAAGFSVQPDLVDDLRAALSQAAAPLLDSYEEVLDLDGELDLESLDMDMCHQLQRLEPFGEANPDPLFLVPGVTVDNARVVGRGHLLLRVRQGSHALRAIGFGMGDRKDDLPNRIDLAARAGIDTFREPRVQLKLQDLRPAEEGS